MNCNILALRKQHRREILPQLPSSVKYLATVVAVCLTALPAPTEAQTTETRSSTGNIDKLLTVNSENWVAEPEASEHDVAFIYGSDSPVGVWVKGKSFEVNADHTEVETSTLFQVGGSAQYPVRTTGTPSSAITNFDNDPSNSAGGIISTSSLYTGKPENTASTPSLTIAVLGSSKGDSLFKAERINSWRGLSTPDDQIDPLYLDIYIDGAKTSHRTSIQVTNSAELSAEKSLNFTVQNSGLFQVGQGLAIKMGNVEDRFIIRDNSEAHTGILVQGTPPKAGSPDQDTNFILSNCAAPPLDSKGNVDTSLKSDKALIINSNVDIPNGVFGLFGGDASGVDVPRNTFLQIINDAESKAVFRAGSIELHSYVSDDSTLQNTTTLLLGHGANVDTDEIVLWAVQKGSSAVLMLGDTLSQDEYYGFKSGTANQQKIESVHFGYVYSDVKSEGESKIIFNNNHHGESAEKASFRIYGPGTVHVQTGRTILTKASLFFSGKTIIDPNATLILTVDKSINLGKNTRGAGSSEITIHRDGELIYDGVTDYFYNAIVGQGNVILKDSYMVLAHDGEWTGKTNIKGRSTLALGTRTDSSHVNSVHMQSSKVTVSEHGTLFGFGSLGGSLINHGYFWIGDNAENATKLSFIVEGDVTNSPSGHLHLGSGKIVPGSLRADGSNFGNTLTINGNYTDNGRLFFNTVLGDDSSPTDKIVVIKDIKPGRSSVWVKNIGGSGAQTTRGIQLIQVNGEKSDGEFTLAKRVTAGPYEYRLMRGIGTDEKNWYLKSHLESDNEDPHRKQIALYRPEAGAYVGNSAVIQGLFSTRLHDRIGDLWYADPYAENNQLTGMWMKQRGNYNSWRESSGQTRNRTQMYATQIGADVASWTSDGKNRFLAGWVAGYGHGRTKSHSIHTGYHAIGTVNGLNVGLTGTWYQDGIHHDGIYVDTWLTYGWFDNKVKGQTLETEKYHSRGFTGSFETGYTLKIGEYVTEKGCDIGWFLQPQAQVIWSGVKTDTFHEHNGTAVKSRGRNNVQTRLGTRLLLDTNLRSYANGIGGTQFFIEGNWVHNTKSHGVEMNGTVLNQEGARNLGELKVGLNGKPTDNLHIWTNVTVRAGTRHYRDLTGMIGLKYCY